VKISTKEINEINNHQSSEAQKNSFTIRGRINKSLKNNLDKQGIQEEYEKSFVQLQKDIENEKIGSHYTKIQYLSSILEQGIYAPLDIEKAREEWKLMTDMYPNVEDSQFQQSSQSHMERLLHIFERRIEESWEEYVLNNLDRIIRVYYGEEKFDKHEKFLTRYKYFRKKIIPKYLEEKKKNNSISLKYIVKKLFGEWLISTIYPHWTKELMQRKLFWASHIHDTTIFFDMPPAIQTYPLGPIHEINDKEWTHWGWSGDLWDLGIASRIKPYRFRAILLNWKHNNNRFDLSFVVRERDIRPWKTIDDIRTDIETTFKKILWFQKTS